LENITREIKSISNCFTICGGVQPTLESGEHSKNSWLDALVRGEGEYPMLEFAESFEHKEDYRDIQNFWFKEGKDLYQKCTQTPDYGS